MKKTLLFILYSTLVFSQGAQELPKIIPATPRVAELGKYGTYPVALNTGIPDIKFDLYEITVNEINIPIQLSYHAGGIKVNQEATEVGLGWSILGGEVIHRNVLGIADEKIQGNFNIVPLSTQDLVNSYNPPVGQKTSQYHYLKTIARGGAPDSQPDIFMYTMNGGSGQFIYGRDRKFMTMPYQPINIKIIGTGFEIINEQGTMHNFRKGDATVFEGKEPTLNYVPDWYVNSIVSNNRKDSIQYIYDKIPYYKTTKSQNQTIGRNLHADINGIVRAETISNGISESIETITQTECFIKQINFNQGKIIFNYSSSRLDKPSDGTGRRLDSITVYDLKNTLIKKIEFYYDYFQSTDSWGIRYRLKLTGFSEIGTLGNQKEYKFEYNTDVEIPAIGSYAQDYWGFYNGIGNTGLIPRVTVKGTEVGSTYVQDYNTTWSIGNADRSVNVGKMQMGMLKKIIYPTKGYTLLEFEPHAYQSQYISQQNKYAGGRTDGKGTRTKSENIYTFSSGVDATANISLYFSPPMPAFSEIAEHPQLVVLKDLTIGVELLRRWHDNDINKPLSYSLSQNLIKDHNYQLIVTVYGVTNVTTPAGYQATYTRADVTWNEPTTIQATAYGGGLRISSSKSYQADGTPGLFEDYKYGTTEGGIGEKLFDEKIFFKNYDDTKLLAVEKCYGATVNGWIEGWQRTYMGIDSYSAITCSGVPVIYKEVVKYTGTNVAFSNKTKYNYELLLDFMGASEDFINSSNYGSVIQVWNQTNLKTETQYKRDGTVFTPVQITENIYDNYYSKYNYGFMFKEKSKFLTSEETGVYCEPQGGDDLQPSWILTKEIPFWSRAYRKKQEKKISYLPDTTKALENTTNFFYDNPVHMQITRTEKIASDGKTNISKFIFPDDITNVNSIVSDLTSTEKAAIDRLKEPDLHRITEPVQVESIVKDVNGTIIGNSIQRTSYKEWTTDLVIPEYLKSLKGIALSSTTMDTHIVFYNYDEKGNPVEVSQTNGMHIVYIWGYNKSVPIAKIENAAIVQVAAALGLSDLNSVDENSLTAINSLRTSLPNAMITTYTYIPLVGVSTITDPKGDKITYSYDPFGRLQFVKDKNGNILSENQYNYKQ